MSQDAAEPESYYGNPDEISSKKRKKMKHKDDIPDKIIRLAIKNLSQKKSDNDDAIWPIIWDFAGQAIYRAIHPIFISREAIYVLMLDLTKDLSAIAQCCVKEPNYKEDEILAPDSNDTNLDHIMRWMDLVHSFKHVENGEILPPVILVGTHADLLQEDPGDKMMKVKDKICDTARDLSDHIIGKTFTVNNTLAGKQHDEEDQQIVNLRQEILKMGEGMPHTKEEVPLKWLQVENEVCDLASKGTNYITREVFENNICDKICQFDIEDDFEVLLHFLHDRGTVVYHGSANDKRSLVVLNPMWLVYILFQIITVEKQSEEKTRIHNLRKRLGMYGILDAELLDDSCERLKLNGIKDSLLHIMKKFNLLCEYTSKEGSSIYLVPCMLTSKPDDKRKLNIFGNQEPAPVYITFNTHYVPGGLFSRLVVLFVEYAEIILTDQPELSANFARFFIGEFTVIEFVCYKRVIKVQVWDHTNSNSNPVEMEPLICLKLLS
ncbi:hypothetical protein OS493_013073 [Desmophyllum pertusum]|uniref:COR domain-containing protein n=1 Tax=Desmophyllum pertusum TaxID=174260 RepID=A0A9X0CKN4_9CNID|nr:hypothetical protein OS493_013073 [Desmophyllum pertusum]